MVSSWARLNVCCNCQVWIIFGTINFVFLAFLILCSVTCMRSPCAYYFSDVYVRRRLTCLHPFLQTSILRSAQCCCFHSGAALRMHEQAVFSIISMSRTTASCFTLIHMWLLLSSLLGFSHVSRIENDDSVGTRIGTAKWLTILIEAVASPVSEIDFSCNKFLIGSYF